MTLGQIRTRPISEVYRGMIPNLVNKTLRYCATENLSIEPIPVGSVVAKDPATPHGVRLSTAANDVILGLSVANMQRIFTTDLNDTLIYRQGDPVTILEDGDLIMYCESAAMVGQQVFYRIAVAAARDNLSAVANAPGTGLAPLRGARFVQDATPGSLVWIQYRITLPVPA